MSTWQDNVKRFNGLAGRPTPDKLDFEGWNGWLRLNLLQEELKETQAAWDKMALLAKQNLPPHLDRQMRKKLEAEIIDGLVDLIYIAIGSAVEAGVDLDPFWDEVQRANMSKVDGTLGPIEIRADGKILKPAGWKGPDIEGILQRIKEKQRDG